MALLVGAIAPASAQEPRKKIVVGSQIGYPLYAIVNNAGEVDGFSVDVMKAVCKMMGIGTKYAVRSCRPSNRREGTKAVKALSVVRGRIGKVEIIVAKQHLERTVIFHLL